MSASINRFCFVVLLCCVPAARADAAQPTMIVVFHAYTRDLQLDPRLRVVQRLKGDCWVSSLATNRNDAWRCSSSTSIEDPCFSAKPNATQVVCPQDVFKHTVMLLALTKPLPTPASQRGNDSQRLRPPDTEPWVMALGNGAHCVFVEGATFGVGDHRANYACTNGQWIVGYPRETSRERWTATVVDGIHSSALHDVPVTVAVL